MAHAKKTARHARAVAITVVYFVASAAAVGLTRFEGGAACVWIAGAVLLAALISSRPRDWLMIVLPGAFAGTVASGIWGVGWHAAPMVSLVNAGEPLIAAMLIRHWRINRTALDSLPNLGLFIVAVGIVAPATMALPGAALVSAASHTGFTTNVVNWFIAHALGMLTFTPVFMLIANGEFGVRLRSIRRIETIEAAALTSVVALTSLAVFSQVTLPVLFLPVLPLMVITFRFGRFGAVFGIVIIAVIGGGFTLHGSGPVALLHGSFPAHIQFFQFYLGITILTVLPVAADLTRRERLFQQLSDSEARFRLLTENSTDIVMNLHVDGTIRYVSPSIVRLGGYDPATLLGRASIDLIEPEDRDRVRAVHLRALRAPGETFRVEYRGAVSIGEPHWFETHTQAVVDADGQISGVVSAIREISHRKRAETELARAAHTDPLTGLANRRMFDQTLATLLASDPDGHRGCVALFDLDHFKRVNDNFGHAVGDQVLKAFAAAGVAHVRDGDMLARIGGEEFGIVFPDITLATARVVCERIRVAVAAISIPVGDWPVHVTVSIGVAAATAPQAPAIVLEHADKALYEAKALGRNRSSLAA